MNDVIDISTSIDLYIADCARRGLKRTTRATYRRHLEALADASRKRFVHELELLDYEHLLDRWTDSSASTLALGVTAVRRYSHFVWKRGWSETWVAEPLSRPKRPRPEDLDVVTISGADVSRMLLACDDWQELICLATAAYLGARRAALSRARLQDVDFAKGTIRFLEKGSKVAVKPMPDEYLAILRAAQEHGVWASREDYLIPNRRPLLVRRSERSDKVIWNTVKRVAARVGIRVHTHAFRAAFAVQFDEAHPEQLIALKELMGHSQLSTTLIYLRRKDKAKAMEAVRDLSFGASVFPSHAGMPPAGFEPASEANLLPEPIRLKLAEFRDKSRRAPRAPR